MKEEIKCYNKVENVFVVSGAAVGARFKSALWNLQRAEMSHVLALGLSCESDGAVGESRYTLSLIQSSALFLGHLTHEHEMRCNWGLVCVNKTNTGVRRLVIVEAGSKRVEGIISLSDVFQFLLGL